MNNIELLISELVKHNEDAISLELVRDNYLLKAKHRNRPGTYDYYKRNLDVIVTFMHLKGVTSTSQINDQALLSFIDYERTIKKCKNNTINKRLITLKQALKYNVDSGYLKHNPMVKFKMLDKDDVETKIIPFEYVQMIFEHILLLPNTPANLRNKFMFYLLLDTGIRLNEMRNLRVRDLDLDNNIIRLRFTKNKLNRTLPLYPATKKWLELYLEAADPEDYIFIEMKNRAPISRSTLYWVLEDIKKSLPIPKSVSISFHKFRHTFATMSLQNGANLEILRKILGHQDIYQTQRYLHVREDELVEQHMSNSPIQRLKSCTGETPIIQAIA